MSNSGVSWFVPTLVSTALAVGASVIVVKSHLSVFAESMPPRIAITSFNEMESRFTKQMSSEDMERAYDEMTVSIQQLQDAGYMVIDERVVFGAPAGMYMQVPELHESGVDDVTVENFDSESVETGEVVNIDNKDVNRLFSEELFISQ